MTGFASGKYAYRISDRSGFRYRLKDTRKEWNGSIVGKDEYEEKHPQLEPLKTRADAQAVKDARPDRTETSVPNILPLNALLLQQVLPQYRLMSLIMEDQQVIQLGSEM